MNTFVNCIAKSLYLNIFIQIDKTKIFRLTITFKNQMKFFF